MESADPQSSDNYIEVCSNRSGMWVWVSVALGSPTNARTNVPTCYVARLSSAVDELGNGPRHRRVLAQALLNRDVRL